MDWAGLVTTGFLTGFDDVHARAGAPRGTGQISRSVVSRKAIAGNLGAQRGFVNRLRYSHLQQPCRKSDRAFGPA